jgi:hypothetical protein
MSFRFLPRQEKESGDKSLHSKTTLELLDVEPLQAAEARIEIACRAAIVTSNNSIVRSVIVWLRGHLAMEFARDDFGIPLRGVGEIPTPLVDGCVDEFRVVLHEDEDQGVIVEEILVRLDAGGQGLFKGTTCLQGIPIDGHLKGPASEMRFGTLWKQLADEYIRLRIVFVERLAYFLHAEQPRQNDDDQQEPILAK